jgi:AraC family transcriptional regulator
LATVGRPVHTVSRAFLEICGVEVRRELRSAHLQMRDMTSRGSVVLPPHRYGSAHVDLLLRGSMSCSCSRHPYTPWVGMFHPPGAEHRSELCDARTVTLELGKRWLDRLIGQAPVPDKPVVLRGDSLWVATRLVEEFRNLRPASILVIEGLAAQLLAAAARAALDPADHTPLWLAETLERLQQDFSRNLQLNELALELNVHPVRLSRSFRRLTGRTIGEYVRELRVKYVIDRLVEGEENLVELALAAGFYDQSHCTRAFKRATGMTPAAYRRMARDRSREDARLRAADNASD